MLKKTKKDKKQGRTEGSLCVTQHMKPAKDPCATYSLQKLDSQSQPLERSFSPAISCQEMFFRELFSSKSTFQRTLEHRLAAHVGSS